jgi:hypothetical protein
VLSEKLLFHCFKKVFAFLCVIASLRGFSHIQKIFALPCPFSPHPPSAPSPQGEGPSILSSFMLLMFSA